MLQFMRSQRVGHNRVTELNLTDLITCALKSNEMCVAECGFTGTPERFRV